ncbi:MAG: translation initiation factor IF-1 [Pirellulaceae bacterium]|nr:translation initiation factor IF-1 [Pirellulaceae bacterium]
MATKQEALLVTGTVVDALANARFAVQLESGNTIHAYLAGKLRRFNIRVVPGDRVQIELSPYDLTQGRIVYRER